MRWVVQKPRMLQNQSGLELMGLWRGLLHEFWHSTPGCAKFDPFWAVAWSACIRKRAWRRKSLTVVVL